MFVAYKLSSKGKDNVNLLLKNWLNGTILIIIQLFRVKQGLNNNLICTPKLYLNLKKI